MAAHIQNLKDSLPNIPAKRYFTIGEVGELCAVTPSILRYWEREFSQLKPTKRSNRRYYQHHEVVLVRRIRSLLYDYGFTIHGARNQLLLETVDGLDKKSRPSPTLVEVGFDQTTPLSSVPQGSKTSLRDTLLALRNKLAKL